LILNTKQLSATVKLNGNIIDLPVVWTTSNANIATVSSTGLLTLISDGICGIEVSMQDNPNITETLKVTVLATKD
jgi:uncharacterized protein YjdB